MSCIICVCAKVETSTLQRKKELLQSVYLAGTMTPLFFVCSSCTKEMYEHEHSPLEDKKLFDVDDPTKDSGTS